MMWKLLKWMMLLYFLGSCAILIAIVVIAVTAGPSMPHDAILHIRLDGELKETQNADVVSIFRDKPEPTLFSITNGIRRAANDKSIKGLLFDIKNPLFSLAQVQEIEAAMSLFRASKKWNVAFLESAGEYSSGNIAYALALCTDKIVLAPSGDMTLLGLKAEIPFIKNTLARLKIQAHVVRRYEYKNFANLFTEDHMTPEHRKSTEYIVNNMQEDLIQYIAERRDISLEQAQQWLETGPYLASNALEKGMIDQLGYWDTVWEMVQKQSTDESPLLALSDYILLQQPSMWGNTVALIFCEGSIIRGDTLGQDYAGSDILAKAFRDARQAKVSGVLFRVNSPGGSYLASDIIRREVELTRKQGIPVVVSMGAVAASGGYFVSIPANHIVAEPATLTGSIGVFAGIFSLREFWQHWFGVSFDSYATSPNAQVFSSLDGPDEKAKLTIDHFVDEVYRDFTAKVAKARDLPIDQVKQIARGRVWTGKAAKENGLVDELGDLQVALNHLKKEMKYPVQQQVNIKVFPEPKSTWEILQDALAHSAVMAKTIQTGYQNFKQLEAEPGTELMWTPFVPRIY